ncbi:ABC transporter ATP-binding protein [Deinococcus cellulosilyticus NBRC 106333 = KACC 11606]|uniref:ABC transporter ATP-binding protein n=2 Tax=Deinococcus cellulosilyticus TaxID=401558 RepID=A0A511NA80_DEIC1|nr:ABC transporter ATP-binding protein [Deinococcus cellulosilyticus NBRC 106333 = KACC 11606]
MMQETAIETQGLRVRFGDFVALDNLTLQIPSGAFLAVVGPNGAGKSTFMKTLLGLVTPETGQVKVLGRPPGAFPDQIGYVPQIKTFDRSFPAVAIELVLSGVRQAWPGPLRGPERKLAIEALERVGADRLAERPLGRLSGGELQRVYLARALVRRPKLILLDEPATGIDALGEKDMYHMLEAYRKESAATIAMITHDFDVARYHASYVVVLNRTLYGCGHPSTALCEDCLSRAYGHGKHGHKRTL